MPLESITKRILKESESSTEELRDEAMAEARSILAAAKGRVAEIEKAAKAQAALESEKAEREGSAALEAQYRTAFLDAKSGAVEKASRSVAAEVSDMLVRDELPAMLKTGVKQFKAAAGDSLVVITGRNNAKLIESLKLKARYEDIDGFILESEDGKMRMVVSPQALVEQNMDGIRAQVEALLFGKRQPVARQAKSKPAKKKQGKMVSKGRKPVRKG